MYKERRRYIQDGAVNGVYKLPWEHPLRTWNNLLGIRRVYISHFVSLNHVALVE